MCWSRSNKSDKSESLNKCPSQIDSAPKPSNEAIETTENLVTSRETIKEEAGKKPDGVERSDIPVHHRKKKKPIPKFDPSSKPDPVVLSDSKGLRRKPQDIRAAMSKGKTENNTMTDPEFSKSRFTKRDNSRGLNADKTQEASCSKNILTANE
ncbi:unnamed protein product [Bursaphelenchus xylophilus]|uniref:(pine wood nematode) hypothetical protein n=1 Tax=Bursaphelenchus xylophilus TaxID=6326 RepID=A0A1I7RNT6_BURXY|nr:unnamed protein product [Bursaphelenchus xylophilus]CAG9124278.1 unnamed protein product [Bursaphelenchus xylophilus]